MHRTILPYLINPPSATIAIQNILGNIFLFLPLGIFLSLFLYRQVNRLWCLVLLGSFSLSFLFEAVQLLTLSGTLDVDDLILNTLGGIIGYFMYRFCDAYFKRLWNLPLHK